MTLVRGHEIGDHLIEVGLRMPNAASHDPGSVPGVADVLERVGGEQQQVGALAVIVTPAFCRPRRSVLKNGDSTSRQYGPCSAN